MNNCQYFASPIPFDREADDNGKISFQELATSGDKEPLEVGAIYVKSLNFGEKSDRKIEIDVGELLIPESEDQTFEDFSKFARAKRRNSDRVSDSRLGNVLKVNGPFPRHDECVPGFDFGCDPDQDGFLKRTTSVSAAHFSVFVTLSGFDPGERVSGYILLELKKPHSAKKSQPVA
jgi:hypothetical protein